MRKDVCDFVLFSQWSHAHFLSGVNAPGWNEVQRCVSSAWNSLCFSAVFAFSSCADVNMFMFFMMIVSEQTKGHTITEVLRTRRAVECAVRI